MQKSISWKKVFTALALAAAASASIAQGAWPTGPVTVVVPFPAGGSVDAAARFVLPRLAERLQQPVVIENMPGAAGTIGTQRVVRAKPEAVSRVVTSDALLLSRAAYHLGNRHMAVQILEGELRYHHDYVLDDMLRQLGLTPTLDELPFEPESGAYGSGHSFASHPHYHSHEHGRDHSHAHSHEQADGHSHAELTHPCVQQQPKMRPPGDLRVTGVSPHRTGVIHTNWNDDDSAGSNQ